jgi:hypothetical protein
MHWSKLKQQVEGRFAESVTGRVELRLTSYRHAHDGNGRGWITVDGVEVANLCYWRSNLEGEYVPEPGLVRRWILDDDGMRRDDRTNLSGVMSPEVYTQTLMHYLSQSIDEALQSPNYLTKALAMLDRRLGKRRLGALEFGPEEHELVIRFCNLRRQAEGLSGEARHITTA